MRNAQAGNGGSQRAHTVALLLVLALVAGACGSDDAKPTITTAAASGVFPVTVRGVEIPAVPERIVSLSATHTEVLFEIGAGPAVVATDVFSDYPATAAATEKVDAFNLNVEAVAALDPDLVVLSFDPGDAVAGFTALGIPALLFAPPGPATFDDVFAEWRDLGAATGRASEAEALVDEVSRELDQIIAAVPDTAVAPTYFIELDSTLFTAGSGTLIDWVFSRIGLQNIADPAAGPFPQLSAEALVAADPAFYFLADTVCCGETADTVAGRPGFETLTAVTAGRVIELDDSLVSRWGPRLLELVRIVAKEVHGV
jgi:iron complex transport system substrate-binding protein